MRAVFYGTTHTPLVMECGSSSGVNMALDCLHEDVLSKLPWGILRTGTFL